MLFELAPPWSATSASFRLMATHNQRLCFLSAFLAAFLLKIAIASPPAGFSLPDFTVSPDHRYGILLPEEDYSLSNVPGNQLVEIATDRVITTIKAQTGLSDDEDSKTVRWSNDNSLCLWEVEGRWAPRILVLIKIEDGKCPWQVDLLKIGQQEILARTRKAAPGKYAARKQQNKGNGTAFPDGFTVNVRVEGEIQNVRSGNPEAGLRGPPVALPLQFHAELTSNPKQIDWWPKEAQLDSALDGLVTVDGKITVTRFRLREKPSPTALSGSWSELVESRTEESEHPRQGVPAQLSPTIVSSGPSRSEDTRQREGAAKNQVEAVKWYRKAAEQNHADAQYNLGRCYYNGEGVAKDQAEAVKWYRKAAEQNHAYAQDNLGYCYFTGEGVAKDQAEAMKWFRKAAEQNNSDAQFSLGYCYFHGEGVAKDQAEAAKWYRKAAEQNNAYAQDNLGSCYFTGEGVAKDQVEGYKWLLLAGGQGVEKAKGDITTIEKMITRKQIAEGQKLASDFKPQQVPSAGNNSSSTATQHTSGQVDDYKRLTSVPTTGDVRPLDPSSPVLQYFAPTPAAPNPAAPNVPSFGFDPSKPLLTIMSVRDLIVHPDGGVTLVLNEKDKKRMSDLNHEFEGRMLICVGSNEAAGIAKITSPTHNGIIEFSEAHYSGNIARYLRRRFGK